MRRILIALIVAGMTLSTAAAYADSSHTGGDSSASASASASNTNANTNSNTQSQGQEQSTSIKNSNEQGQGQSQGQGQGQKQGQGQLQGQGQGQGQNNGQNISYKSESFAAAPNVYNAALVAAPETCMGSVSVGLSASTGIVGAGAGFGKTYESENCNRRMNARYLLTLAQATGDVRFTAAATALLAQDENVQKALIAAGIISAPAKAAIAPAVTKDAGQQASRAAADRIAAREAFDRAQGQ